MEGVSRLGSALPSDLLLASLYHLGMGRGSILFSYDTKTRSFTPALEDIRTVCYSLASAQSSIACFVQMGNAVKYLQDFVHNSYAGATTVPARTALASAISTILTALDAHITSHGQSARSLLQLHSLFERPQRLVTHLQQTVASLESACTNAEVVSRLYCRAQDVEQQPEWLRQCMLQLLTRVSEPWLELVSEWTGLLSNSAPTDQSASLVEPEEASPGLAGDQTASGYNFSAKMMPDFVSEEDRRMVFETGKSLCFIRKHHPDHPLANLGAFNIKAPALEWKHEWRDIEAVAEKAKEYERRLLQALQEHRQSICRTVRQRHIAVEDAVNLQDSGQNHEQVHHAHVADLAALFDQPPRPSFDNWPDELRKVLANALDSNDTAQACESSTFAPPLSITPLLSLSPLLATQARVVNSESLRLLFRAHGLRLHLSLQRQYHLFGDGMFVTRLSSTLFSPELATAERHRGIIRTGAPMGLKLGSRKTWPPASSELRLALMGVLSDCHHASALQSNSRRGQLKSASREPMAADRAPTELPGNLSFAVRTLSAEDADKCMDPQSLYALDFLRLQYTSPEPLKEVITAAVLERYDQIFKLLLRLLRMLFVVAHLPRGIPSPTARKFRNEAHYFVTAVSAYFSDTGITELCSGFSAYLDDTERRLQREDDNGQIGQLVTGGPESLRIRHEQFLDQMLFALLLRKRQAQVMVLLEEIMEAILRFERLVQERLEGWREAVEQLYAGFRAKIGVFLTVCKGLVGRKGYGKRRAAESGEQNTIERLVLLLDISGYYATANERPP